MRQPQLDKLPPHSQESEQGILGCILLDPNECMPKCISLMPHADPFYDLRHQVIYAAMLKVFDAKPSSLDLITLHQRLKEQNELDQIGGIEYLSALADTVPSVANLEAYIDEVKKKSLLRRAVHAFTRAANRIYSSDGEPDEILDEAEKEMLAVSQARATAVDLSIRQLTQQAVARLEDKFNRQGTISGLATGFSDLDRMTDGFMDGQVVVIGGRPSTGKTSLAMNIVENVALDQGLPVGVFSLEMPAVNLVLRMIASRAEVNIKKIGPYTQEVELVRLTSSSLPISRSNIFIDDRAGLSLLQIRSKARQWVQQFGIRLVVVDYLQLISDAGGSKADRRNEVAAISKGIKCLAKELKLPVIALAQLNRESEKADNKRKPRMSDLNESGQIEADADIVILLYQPEMTIDQLRDTTNSLVYPVNALVAKNRDGEQHADIELMFFKQFTKFKPRAHEDLT